MSTVLARRVREHLTETEPVPEPMTDFEIRRFIKDNCTKVEWLFSGWHVTTDDDVISVAPLFEGAIGLAAAKYKEMNDG